MQQNPQEEPRPEVSTPIEGLGLRVLDKLKDWSLVFGIVGLVYLGCTVVGGVLSVIGLPSMLWHLIYMTLGFHLNVIIVLCAILIGLSAFTFSRAAVFSKRVDSDLSQAARPSIQSLRHLRAAFMGLCLLIVTIALGVLYLFVAVSVVSTGSI